MRDAGHVPRFATRAGIATACAFIALAVLATAVTFPPGPSAQIQTHAPWVVSFSKPISGWKKEGKLKAARVRWRGDPALVLSRPGKDGGTLSHPLPAKRWALSLDLALAPGARVELGLGDAKGRHALKVVRFSSGGPQLQRGNGSTTPLSKSQNPADGNWVHLQVRALAHSVEGTIGGRPFKLKRRPSDVLSVTLTKRRLRLDNVIATATDRESLLLHRLADLEARVPPGGSLVGADNKDRLDLRPRIWTRGFLPGSFWLAAASTRRSDLFESWAIERTAGNFGLETSDTHDQGFLYEISSVAAFRRVCRTATSRAEPLCQRLRASALTAANRLLELAASNQGAGTIPTGANHPSDHSLSDTLIDSMMNLPLLYWASRETGDPRYRDVAALHAHRVAELLVRPDGSTAQSVHMDRKTGKVLRIHSHQGLNSYSTWARGQAWAIYGFTTSAAALQDRELLATAEHAAEWADAHLPPSGIPRYDYFAPDSSGNANAAAVITAAGLYRLAALCKLWPDGCNQPQRWKVLADFMLGAALWDVSRVPPLGFFAGSTDLGRDKYGPVQERGERIFGLYYALEAIKLRARSAEG
jgi:unsaturated chondroitin disaccharide hydrolase